MRLLLLLLSLLPASLLAQRFYSDDPLDKEPRPASAEKVANRKLSDYYDLFSNQFTTRGEKQKKDSSPIPSSAVNTIGEPMDGAWYTKRHYYHPMSKEDLLLGPGKNTPPDRSAKWTVVGAKAEGITRGFTIIDLAKRRFYLKFDPVTNLEMATAADSIVSRFFHALGYHVPDNYIVNFTPDQLQLGEKVEFYDRKGRLRAMLQKDLDAILAEVPRTAEGSFRATASLAVEGQPIGQPRYYGTRRDDPNDLVPHEHRRDLRGLAIFCAWLGHDDSRDINNLDTLVTQDGVQFIRHYLLDFGSTLGSASSAANSPRSGAYFFSWSESAKQLFTLGLAPPYWAFADYPKMPSVGKFEWKVFDPEKWVPEYPNTAFINRLPDDEFWAAKQVMAFSDDDIRTIVGAGHYSDPKAAEYVVECIRQRRDKIGKVYFAKVLPFDRFRVDGGSLAWDDLAQAHNLGAVNDVKVAWSGYENGKAVKTPLSGADSRSIPNENGYLAADLTSASRPKQTITVYLRRNANDTKVIGLFRTW